MCVENKNLRTDSNNAQFEGFQTELRGCKNRSSEIRINTPKPGRTTTFNGVRRAEPKVKRTPCVTGPAVCGLRRPIRRLVLP